jgi:hypothetical protein
VRTESLLIGNDNSLTLDGLRNGESGEFINSAVVMATLTTMAGAVVPGQTFPAPMQYVTDSQGCYRLILKGALTLVNGQYYKVQVSADGGGLKAAWTLIYKAVARVS